MAESDSRSPITQIEKTAPATRHNLVDYQRCVDDFDWMEARQWLSPSGPGPGLNMAQQAVDRHVAAGFGDQLALRWLGQQPQDFTYRQLMEQSNRFASLLASLHIQPGETVFGLAGRVPQLYFAVLGTLKLGAVFAPLFSAFGPEPIRARMAIGKASALVTSAALYRKKVLPWRSEMPHLRLVLLYGVTERDRAAGLPGEGCVDLDQALAEAGPEFTPRQCQPDELALLHFTSGTTGTPKGVMHVHPAVLSHAWSGHYALDLQAGDIFWCTADPGWVTGTSYGIISPLCNRVSLIVDPQEFDARRWYQILAQQRVNVWYTAPTAVRMLMKAGDELVAEHDFSALRYMASVGEPLNPEAVIWGQRLFGQPFHDNWWQSETGSIMIANYASQAVRPGSMGRPLPGIQAAVVERLADGTVRVVKQPQQVGELALRTGWPSMFRGYLDQPERYAACFAADSDQPAISWYLSGDLAQQDSDGYFWFVGRADDVIKSAGHLIGPFEVESVLMAHPAVAEAGVIGIPDEMAGELVKAFVALKPGFEPGPELLRQIMGHARKQLGAAVAPREIAFRPGLPKTRSGKIMRRLLKARELGLPEGDLSTLESEQ